MNSKTSITSEQIAEIFRKHDLARQAAAKRLTTGFTNEVHAVDGYILKICVNERNEPNFNREVFLYKALQGIVKAPEPVVVDTSKTLIDKFYMIYKRIEGEPVGRRWHLLTDSQRKKLIEDLCLQLRRIDNFPRVEYAHQFGLNPNLPWQEDTVNGLFKALSIVDEQGILSEALVQRIGKYVNETGHVLRPRKLGLAYWDVQFDNMLVNSRSHFAGLIDFEGVGITSIDYRLSIVRVMSERPHLFMSEEMESCAVAEDYTHLMDWYQEFYPELFDFPDLKKRLDLYELGDILNKLPAWPKTRQLHDRLTKILEN